MTPATKPASTLPPDAPCLACTEHRVCGCPATPRWCKAKRPEVESGGVGCGGFMAKKSDG